MVGKHVHVIIVASFENALCPRVTTKALSRSPEFRARMTFFFFFFLSLSVYWALNIKKEHFPVILPVHITYALPAPGVDASDGKVNGSAKLSIIFISKLR